MGLPALLVVAWVIVPKVDLLMVVSPMLLAETDETAPEALILAELPTPVSAVEAIVPVLVIAPVLFVVWPIVPMALVPATVSVLLMLARETEDMPPVALTDTPAPTPDTAPGVIVPMLVTGPKLTGVWLTLPAVLVTPVRPALAPSMLASETEATEPVAPIDAPAPAPESAPTVRMPLFVTPMPWPVTVAAEVSLCGLCVMLPNVVPAVPRLPIEEPETEALTPVALTDADAPRPERAPVEMLPVFTTRAAPVKV
jgi:hypothetical protein